MFFPLPLAMPQEVQPQAEQAPVNKGVYVQSPSGVNDFTTLIKKHADSFPALKNWNIILLSDQAWEPLRKQVTIPEHPTDSAFSFLGSNRTYLKQSFLQGKSDDQILKLLAHEYGHLVLNSHKEDDANGWAKKYLNKKK